MNDHGRRRLGTLVGVGLAGGLLPGITFDGEGVDVLLGLMVTALVVVVLTQLVYVGPSGRVPVRVLAVFGAIGFAQDALIWWLLSWLAPKISTLHVEGWGTVLLAALLTRGSVLAASQLTSRVEIAQE
ncbi:MULTISPECIES: hypothetical protein [unclassified Streptomyces]|uniref:hypothetical protein n=1 Tax=unclassified Streptomyces TaxID=2593676 RepID=UPI0036FDEB6E